jgi:hypothetical protein
MLGLVGGFIVAAKAGQTTNPQAAWVAWGIALGSASLEIYSGWWSVVLRGMNAVLQSARILFFCHALKLVLAGALLLAGGGLIGVFSASFVCSLLIRWFARKACLARLPPPTSAPPSRPEILSLLHRLWPNSWRTALQLMSASLAANCYHAICTDVFGGSITANAQYGLSTMIATTAASIAAVWVNVKWPIVGQLRTRHDYEGLRHLLRPRFWYQAGTFAVMALLAAGLGPTLLSWVGAKTQLIPRPWFPLLMLAAFLDMQVAFWTSFLATENRIPSVWPVVITNLTSIMLVFILTRLAGPGWGPFVLVPFTLNLLFNYWYWPLEGARNLRTTWPRFAFSRA